ncbi:MAG TPA: hypothetical protein VFF94_02290, partial [Novosphingobium sp.]|nr:hypothetical protein [Novosphingobium sp.]
MTSLPVPGSARPDAAHKGNSAGALARRPASARPASAKLASLALLASAGAPVALHAQEIASPAPADAPLPADASLPADSGPAASPGEAHGLKALRLSGFATLGFTYNDNSHAGVITSYAQAHPANSGFSADLDSVVGVQAVWTPLKGTSITVQLVARPDNGMKPAVRMAYLRHELTPSLAVRGGRIRSPLYFDSDVSEVGYAYLTARPPIPLYTIVNSVDTLDGGDVQWRHSWHDVAVLLQAYYGNSQYRHHFYNDGFAAHAKLTGIKGGAVSLILPWITLRASRTWISSYTMRGGAIDTLDAGLETLATQMNAAAANPYLPAGYGAALGAQASAISALMYPFDNHPIYTSVGFDASFNKLRVLGEWAELDSRSRMVGRYQGYQVTVGYALGNVTPYATYARQRRLGPALDTSALNATGLSEQLDAGLAQMQQALALAGSYANLSGSSLSLGARWDVREHVAIKAQYD